MENRKTVFCLLATIAVSVAILTSNLSSASGFDVPQICATNSLHELKEANDRFWEMPEDVLFHGKSTDIVEAIFKLKQRVYLDLAPWLLQEPGEKSIAGAAYLIQQFLAQTLINRHIPGTNAETILTQAASHPAHYSPEAQEQALRFMRSYLKEPVAKGITAMKETAIVLCSQFPDPACPLALRRVADLMSTRIAGTAYVSLPAVVKRLVLDPTLVQGASHFALKILNRLKNRMSAFSERHLLDDLIDSYIQTGSSVPEATERAWVILGWYGARGASVSFLEQIPNRENLPLFLNLYLFSAALALLDNNTLASSHFYSYPESVESRCIYPRPYHFWLSAYLTHELMNHGYPAKTAIVATHIASKLYEFGAQTVTRNPDRPYRDKFFNDYNISIQRNMAFNDAGAFFAAHFVAPGDPMIHPDEGINRIFSEARPMPKLTEKELEAGLKNFLVRYMWFHRVIAPDAYLNEFIPVRPVEVLRSAIR